MSRCNGIIENNIFSSNSVQNSGGIYNCTGTKLNNTIAGNIAVDYGGGLYNFPDTVVNCIIWENNVTLGPQLWGSATVTYCCIQDWTGGGEGNISENPIFVNPYMSPYACLRYTIKTYEIFDFNPALFVRSPCINAGDNSVVTELFDIEGNQRIQGPNVDMGCYECPADADVDGMADLWETANFGDTSAVSNDDSDSDDLINIAEFVLRCDPLNEFNVKTFIRKDGADTATVLWNSVATHQYKFWESNNLLEWSISEDWQAGSGSWIYRSRPMPYLDMIFYKVEYKSLP